MYPILDRLRGRYIAQRGSNIKPTPLTIMEMWQRGRLRQTVNLFFKQRGGSNPSVSTNNTLMDKLVKSALSKGAVLSVRIRVRVPFYLPEIYSQRDSSTRLEGKYNSNNTPVAHTNWYSYWS